ncbi:MAG: glycosyltransferase family 4 protein [Thermoflexales bacterium]
MKVAVNAWFLDSPLEHTTGTGQYARRIVSEIARLAPDVHMELVYPRRRDDWSKLYFEQVQFPSEAARMGADLAFVPYWAPPLASRVPVVVTVHDVIPLALPAYRGGLLQRAYTSLVRAASANARAVITDSEFSRRDVLRYLPVEERCVSVVPLAAGAEYHPLVAEAERQRVRQRYNLPDNYVLYLSGFDARKNIETLLQVYVWCGESIGEEFALVVNATEDTPVVANNGQRMTLGAMMDALEVREYVRCIGPVAEADKPALYAGARAFLFPSTYEGFGLPVLEAMACGVPVVGSNAASVAEVVGNAGMLVDPLDARSMAGALIAVCIEDDLHQVLRQRALLRAAQFSWQAAAMATLAVFRKVMDAS